MFEEKKKISLTSYIFPRKYCIVWIIGILARRALQHYSISIACLRMSSTGRHSPIFSVSSHPI